MLYLHCWMRTITNDQLPNDTKLNENMKAILTIFFSILFLALAHYIGDKALEKRNKGIMDRIFSMALGCIIASAVIGTLIGALFLMYALVSLSLDSM
jgi:uncharacterized membrane protein